jgi:hypothetical protein
VVVIHTSRLPERFSFMRFHDRYILERYFGSICDFSSVSKLESSWLGHLVCYVALVPGPRKIYRVSHRKIVFFSLLPLLPSLCKLQGELSEVEFELS